MPRKPSQETPEKRARRLEVQRAYEARRRLEDPIGFARASADAQNRYRAANPEKSKAATKKWRMANKPRFNELRRIWRCNNIVKSLLSEARSRSKTKGIEFDISLEDIPPMGSCCPLLGHPFPPPEVRDGKFTPSLDRIDPTKGYVKGNVWIVGRRANMIKNDGTAEEHEAIARAMRLAL